jgi:hypothetical protein
MQRRPLTLTALSCMIMPPGPALAKPLVGIQELCRAPTAAGRDHSCAAWLEPLQLAPRDDAILACCCSAPAARLAMRKSGCMVSVLRSARGLARSEVDCGWLEGWQSTCWRVGTARRAPW